MLHLKLISDETDGHGDGDRRLHRVMVGHTVADHEVLVSPVHTRHKLNGFAPAGELQAYGRTEHGKWWHRIELVEAVGVVSMGTAEMCNTYVAVSVREEYRRAASPRAQPQARVVVRPHTRRVGLMNDIACTTAPLTAQHYVRL